MKPQFSLPSLAAAVAPVVLAGGMLVPGAGASPASLSGRNGASATAAAAQDTSKRFVMRNYSSHAIRLSMASGDFLSAPPAGSVIPPGGDQHFEMASFPLSREHPSGTYGHAFYFVVGANGRDTAHLITAAMAAYRNDAWVACETSLGECTPHPARSGEALNGRVKGNTITFEDDPGTNITVGAARREEQAKLLGLCENADARCSFKPTSEERALSDWRPAGHKVINDSNRDLRTRYQARDIVSASTRAGTEITRDVEQIIEPEITRKYQRDWTSRHEFAEDFEVTIAPDTTVWALHRAPIIRDTGNFTIILGNTTWHLTGISFDTPDTEQGRQGEFKLQQEGPRFSGDFSQRIVQIGADQARVSFTPTTPASLVDVHYVVDRADQQNFRMKEENGTWRHTITGLRANDVITYWFTYEKSGRLIDSSPYTFTQPAAGAGGSTSRPRPSAVR